MCALRFVPGARENMHIHTPIVHERAHAIRRVTEALADDELLHDTHVVVASAEHADLMSNVVDPDKERLRAPRIRGFDRERRPEVHVV